jgi:hypothetical protein
VDPIEIKLYPLVGSVAHLPEAEAQAFYEVINTYLHAGYPVILDFEHVGGFVCAFGHRVFGQLLKERTPAELKGKVTLLNLDPHYRDLANRIMKLACTFYGHNKEASHG